MCKKIFLCCVACALFIVMNGCDSQSDFESRIESGNYQSAISIYEQKIQGNSNKEGKAKNFVSQYLKENIDSFARGETDAQTMENIIDRLTKLDDATQILNVELGNSLETFTHLSTSKENYARALQHFDEGDYLETIEECKNVYSEDVENYTAAQELANSAAGKYEVIMITGVEQDCFDKEFAEAWHMINVAHEALPDSSLLAETLDEVRNDYVQYTIDVAKEQFGDEKNYSAAIKTINVALADLGEDESLVSEYNRYAEYVPIYLATLDYDTKGRYIYIGGAYDSIATDVLGNTYVSDYIFYPTGGNLNSEVGTTEDEGAVEYFLNSKYSTLSGTLYLPYQSRAAEAPTVSSVFKVYGDGTLLYEAPTFIRGTVDPVDFNIDISGVRNLRVVVLGVWTDKNTGWVGWNSRYPMVCAADMMVSK